MTKNTLRSLGIAIAASMLVAGCGGGGEPAKRGTLAQGGWQSVLGAAKKEGKVTWYTVAPQQVQKDLEGAFEKAYPDIDLEVRSAHPNELDSAIETEQKTGTEGADVVTSVSYTWVEDKSRQGWFADLLGPSTKASEWSGEFMIDRRILVAPLGLIVLGWNKQLLPGGVKTYQDLLNPDLAKGAIGVPSSEVAINADFWAFLEDNYGADFVASLAKQKPAKYTGAFSTQEALAAGEIAVGMFVSATDMSGLKQKGAPVDFAVPNPAWAAQNLFFALKHAYHPNASQVFMDFLASPEGQMAVARNAYSPLKAVAPKTVGAGTKVVLTNVDRMTDKKWVADYNAKWKSMFG
jgi:iron(III) transport system substrate-binding protein